MNAHRTSVYLLVVTVIALIVLGLVMLSSTSAYAPESHGSAVFLLKRQLMWLGIGVLVCAIGAGLDYHLLQMPSLHRLRVATLPPIHISENDTNTKKPTLSHE